MPDTVPAAERGLLRFLTCGSVDDGKSTLIGRLLYDARLVLEDQLAAVTRDTVGGEEPDLSLLVDGLEAERAQGITIDVAYRFFRTPKRAFIVADTPGHEQYTRNMATGASNCDLAVLLVDARKGLLTQTRRHAHICALLGIRHLVLAVNKMDLIPTEEAEATFERIAAGFRAFAEPLGLGSVMALPVSAKRGDNVTRPGGLPWYAGPTLLEVLETTAAGTDAGAAAALPFRLPVQYVQRPDQDFRGLAGRVASGRIARGEAVVVAPSGRPATVARILDADGADAAVAEAGESVTLVLAEDTDATRGDLLAAATAPPVVADRFQAHLIWLDEAPLLPGRSYLLRAGGGAWVPASVAAIRHAVSPDTMEPLAARTLALNGIAVCDLATAAPLAFDAYAENRGIGAFILVDRGTNRTAAAGMIRFALRRSGNITPQALGVERAARAAAKHQRPAVLWFTGLSGAGKSTIAQALDARLHALGHHAYVLDGDNLRGGLCKDLGFTAADRVENIRRAAEVAALFADAGLIVLCAFISPFRAERRLARELAAAAGVEFLEVFVDTPLATCEARDPKGLYARARRGEIRNFTGLDSPYEVPEAPELRLDTGAAPEALAAALVDALRARGVVL